MVQPRFKYILQIIRKFFVTRDEKDMFPQDIFSVSVNFHQKRPIHQYKKEVLRRNSWLFPLLMRAMFTQVFFVVLI